MSALSLALLVALTACACQDAPSGRRLPVTGDFGPPTPVVPLDGGGSPPPVDATPPTPEPDFGPFEPATALTIATYNVENLFDLIDDPDTDEGEFTPTPGGWGASQLATRLAYLGRAFATIDADIVAVNEIENVEILEQLRDAISAAGGPNYPVALVAPSRDPRGIDVGLLSRYPVVRSLGRPINIEHPCTGDDGQPVTLDGSWPEARPILQADVDLDGDREVDLTFLVNHWKAKGRSYPCSGEEHRLRSGRQIREIVNALIAESPAVGVVVLGDFNTFEFEPPLRDAAGAGLDASAATAPSDLYNTWGEAGVDGTHDRNDNAWNTVANSSYNFDGDWTRLDHILVTGNLLGGGSAGWRLVAGATEPVHADFLLDDRGHPTSWNLRDGRGYSDHLPVRTRLAPAP